MKTNFTSITLSLFLFFSGSLQAQITSSSQWTWMKGDNTYSAISVYGTKGVAAATNKPGARFGHITWTDSTGNFWLFGGSQDCCSGLNLLNDLWKYSPATNMWTWVSGDSALNQVSVFGAKGIADPANKPGARFSSVSWTDALGNLWLFGGGQYDFGGNKYSDLWNYTTATNLWTWVSGDSASNQSGVYGTQGTPSANNKPGARNNSISWTDATGNLWLYGGNNSLGFDDLWRYNPLTNQWTWMKGTSTENQNTGIYGIQGTPDAANYPRSRTVSVSWADNTGNLWLLGGKVTSGEKLNDLWRYNPTANMWTWVSGSNLTNQVSIYGTKGTAASANRPGARFGSTKWTDKFGNLWLFGGWGFDAAADNFLNDFWKYNIATNQWTWINGSQQGVYGTMGVQSPTNYPGVRYKSTSFIDPSGNFWLFGGNPNTNDLWRLSNVIALPITFASLKAYQQGTNIAVEWKVDNESSIKQYEIEKGVEGQVFTKAGVQPATGNNTSKVSYAWLDANAQTGNNYYRIRSNSLNGEFKYSEIVKINISKGRGGYTVYPNPVINSLLQVQFINRLKGLYELRISTTVGQVVMVKEVDHQEGSSTESMQLPNNLTKGNYTVEVIAPDKSKQSFMFVY